jgi:cellulose synthase (UDP-forming)
VIARGLAATTLALTLAYLLWRTSSTLSPPVILLGLPLLILEFWSLAVLATDTIALWRVPTVRTTPDDDVAQDVTVVVPTTTEPLELLAPVLAAATAMRASTSVIVLDDGHREWLAGICDELGIDYRSRSTPSDCLGSQLTSVLDTIEDGIAVILAPDQIADRDLVERTLGHFADPSVALVQTAIDVYNPGSFGYLGDDPYAADRVMAAGLDARAATLWRGGVALVRVSALKNLGALPSGDPRSWLSVELHAAGQRVVYHDEVLARGRAALDAQQFACDQRDQAASDAVTLRRTRWARGLRPVPRLLVVRQLGAGVDSWRRLALLLLPALVLLLGASPASGPVWAFTILFGVTALLNVAVRRVLGGRRGPGGSVRSVLAMNASLGAIRRLVTGQPSPQRRDADASRRVHPTLWALAGVNLAGLVALAVRAGVADSPLPLPITLLATTWCTVNLIVLARAITRVRSRAFGGDRRASHRVEAEGHVFVDGQRTHVLDLSLRGIRVLTYADPPAVEEYCAVTFTDPRGRLAVVTGTIVDVRQRPHGHEIRIAFDADQTYVLGVIVAGALNPHPQSPPPEPTP